MSPEQLSGRDQVTLQSDIFSLGVTLHELLTGWRPSGRPGLPPQASDIQKNRPDVDMSLIALVADMLAVDPTKRPISMAAVETRLRAIAPPANLSELVADYYRGKSSGIPALASGFARADTEASALLVRQIVNRLLQYRAAPIRWWLLQSCRHRNTQVSCNERKP